MPFCSHRGPCEIAALAVRSHPPTEGSALNTEAAANEIAVVVRLPRELRDALKARAVAEDRSVASLLRRAARDYLRDAESSS